MSLQTTKCGVCELTTSRYRCPCCSIATCSLACSRSHKETTACSGVRDKLAFRSLHEFTDLDLLSDVHFLEDAERQVDAACRSCRDVLEPISAAHHLQGTKLQALARRHGVVLKVLPYPLSRRRLNKSYYHYKLNEMEWQIEWVFPQVNAKYTNKAIASVTLSDALDPLINPASQLGFFSPLLTGYTRQRQQLRLFMKVEGRRADSVRYYELQMNKSLKESLAGKVVIEFPTIHIVYGEECDKYTLLDDNINPLKPQS